MLGWEGGTAGTRAPVVRNHGADSTVRPGRMTLAHRQHGFTSPSGHVVQRRSLSCLGLGSSRLPGKPAQDATRYSLLHCVLPCTAAHSPAPWHQERGVNPHLTFYPRPPRRLVEPEGGSIVLDGVDLLQLGAWGGG